MDVREVLLDPKNYAFFFNCKELVEYHVTLGLTKIYN